MSSDHIPTFLSISLIIPIVKSHCKPLHDPNNYKGINLIPILTKIFEKLIINKCPQLKDHKITQFGFTSDAFTVYAEFLIKDTISYYNTKGTPVYLCSLGADTLTIHI